MESPEREKQVEVGRAEERPRGGELLRLWAAAFLPPLAWLLDLQISYAIADWSCRTGNLWTLDLVAVAALALAVAGGALAWSSRKSAGEREGGPQRSVVRLFIVAGLTSALFFALVIIVTAIPNVVLRSCP